jgi:hypothetical protein
MQWPHVVSEPYEERNQGNESHESKVKSSLSRASYGVVYLNKQAPEMFRSSSSCLITMLHRAILLFAIGDASGLSVKSLASGRKKRPACQVG